MVLFLFRIYASAIAADYDLTVIGFHKFDESIGRRTIAQIRTLFRDLNINYIDSRPKRSVDVDIERQILEIMKNPDKTPGKVAFFVDIMTEGKKQLYKKTPKSQIKFAFVTVESSKIPRSWTNALNTYFDGVVVPDIWLVEVLEKAGVKIPIFVLPEICYLEDFLAEPLQQNPRSPFVFGISAIMANNKNYDLLLAAFISEFEDSENVILKIHSGYGKGEICKKIKSLASKKIIVHKKYIGWKDYVEYMKSIDCYVLLSRGEGFSVTPREALALGHPCILANNTAHKTICATGLVRSVRSNIIINHDGQFYDECLGHYFNCDLNDARKALRDVYENYDVYLKMAYEGREWVKQYLSCNLRSKYLSLFKPKKIILGTSNEAGEDYLMTNSETLYKKYTNLT